MYEKGCRTSEIILHEGFFFLDPNFVDSRLVQILTIFIIKQICKLIRIDVAMMHSIMLACMLHNTLPYAARYKDWGFISGE